MVTVHDRSLALGREIAASIYIQAALLV
jgi:hypothetical protein